MSSKYERKQRELNRQMAKENPNIYDFDYFTGELKPSRMAERQSERMRKELKKALDSL